MESGVHDSVELPALEESRAARRIIAVGGGKGGAGKSLLAANVGIYLATLGKRVVLLDADLGGANLHTFVGVERPRLTLGDLFEKRVARVEDVVVETAVTGVGLVSGEGDPSWIANPRPAQKFRLLNQVQKLDVDYLVVDLGPGSGFNAIDFFLLADVGVLVVVPEPTSVENTYRFIKSAFLRRLRRRGLERVLGLVHEGDRAFEGGIPSPYDLFLAAREADPALAEELYTEMRRFRPRIVVNQVRARSDEDLGPALCTAARRRMGITIETLGALEHDDAVWLAVRKRRPLLTEHPDSLYAKGVERVARRLLALENVETPPAPVKPTSEQTHYEVLEIDPQATEEEIRRAHRRVRDIYGVDSLVVCGLFNRERIADLHERFELAYDVLLDPERRRAYDLKLFPEGLPTRRRTPASGVTAVELDPTPAAPEPRPAPPDVPPDTEFSGEVLRRIREARGIDLHSISQKTKIGIGHLRAIEEERFDIMPALVYLRGFLQEYAKCLRLDPGRVTSTYLQRVQRS